MGAGGVKVRIIPSCLDNTEGNFLSYGVEEVEPGLFRYTHHKVLASRVVVDQLRYRGEVEWTGDESEK